MERPKLLDVCLYLRSPLACEGQKRYFVVFRSEVYPHPVVSSWLDPDECSEEHHPEVIAEGKRREFKYVLDVFSDGGDEDEFETLEKSCVLFSEDADFEKRLRKYEDQANEWIAG